MADVDVDDGCHGDPSLPADGALDAAADVEDVNTIQPNCSEDSSAKIQQPVENQPDEEGGVILPSLDEDSDEGMYS